jgi:Tfp pilus assembly protein PilF
MNNLIICLIPLSLLLLVLVSAACASPPVRLPETKMGSIDAASQSAADAYYHFMVATILEQDNEIDAALQEYEEAYRHDPNSAEIVLSLATLSLRKGQTDQATRYAQKAADLEPKNERGY